MIAIGLLFVRMLCDCFRPRQQLEAEILVLRHQLTAASTAFPPWRRIDMPASAADDELAETAA
jgi:hypothetical protein